MQETISSNGQKNEDELLELQNTQYNLMMLQQKRNELEQLRTLLQAAMESGDMEALGQLSDLIQDLPDISDASETQQETENDRDMLIYKQNSQKAHLADLEKEQDQLQKNAEEQREALAQKRGKLQELQLKLSEIKAEGPWASTEAQVVTLVNPDGLDRNVSNVTLIDESFDENDDDQMEENEQYIQDQERSLEELRQRIEMLQQLKKELENTQAQNVEDVSGDNLQENLEDSDETLENLLRKLASASIDEIKAADFSTATSQQNIVLASQDKVEDKQPKVDGFDDENADMKIRESILQATLHVKDLETAIASTSNPEEKKVYMELHQKLTRQLSELVEVESKLNYYRSVIKANQEEESVIQELSEVIMTNPEVIAKEMPKILQSSLPQPRVTEDSSFIHQAHIESLVNSKRSVSNAWSEASKSMNFENRSEAWGAKELGSSVLPQRRVMSGESRRPTSSMAGEGSWQSEASSSKSKRLFDSMKTDIYRHTASFIAAFENEPYFLLSFLKKIKKIDSSYLKQKLLVTLDNLLEEEEDLEGQSAESIDEGSGINKNTPQTTNSDWEIVMKSRVSEFLMNMTRDPLNQILNAFQLSKLNHFVLSLVHNMLYSNIDVNSEESESLQDRLTILIDLLKPTLDDKTLVFQGRRLLSVQAEILSIIFQEMHHVCEEWARCMESNNRLMRWEHFSKTSL